MVNLPVEYASRQVTPFGGMRLMKELVDKTKIRDFLRTLDLPQPGSNRGFDPVQIIESFWLSIWTGASRYVHADWLRYDKVLHDIFGWDTMPSQSTYSRFFHKFSWKRNNEIFPELQKWFFDQLTLDNITLDLDSSVITRYGTQQGSKVGYNPDKPGRASHHPLMAFIAQTRMVANAWMRSGDTAAVSNAEAFFKETFDIVGQKKIGLVRADSGFYSNRFLQSFEERNLHYIVAVKFYAPIKYEIQQVKNWTNISQGVQVADFYYKPVKGKRRRYVVIRKNIERKPKASGKLLLFDEAELSPRWRYSVLVTNLNTPKDTIWQMYNPRADAENRIKELKYDFGADNFCLKEFWATEASFRFIMVAYNLMSLFRHLAIQSPQKATLSSLRFQCFALGAWISNHANRKTLKIYLATKRRPWLDGLFAKIGQASPPFVYSNA